MPVFNAEHTLNVCLESILAQTFQQYEVIVVNAFPNDNSMGVLRSYGDPRIRLVENEHKGNVPALNVGIKNCRTDLDARTHGCG